MALARTIWFLAISRPRANTRSVVFRSGARAAYGLQSEEVDSPAIGCFCPIRRQAEWHFGKTPSTRATIEEAISLAKELNDMHGLAVALANAAALGYVERSAAEVESFATALIELSTRQSLAHWLAMGAVYRGWARSASGDTAEGISWIEGGIEDYRASGAFVGPLFLLKAKPCTLRIVPPKPLKQ